jgi:hypothetical protein
MLNKKDKIQTLFGWLRTKLYEPFSSVWNFKHFYLNPAIKWIKLSKVFLKFWKIPFAIEDLQLASKYAIKQNRQDGKHISDLNNKIEALIEDVADLAYHYNPKPSGLTDDEYYKKCMRNAFKANCDDYFPSEDECLAWVKIGDVRLATKYLTKDEEDHRFDLDYEHHRGAMCGYENDFYDEATYLLGSLSRRGFYDN